MGWTAVPASMEHLEQVTAFTGSLLEEAGCGENDRRLIQISVEELFTNIASYAYEGGQGMVYIECRIQRSGEGFKEVMICFQDQGIPYNPLEREDPDLTLPIEQRPVGGLGIYMVKQFMDQVDYEYKKGCNRTVITKRFRTAVLVPGGAKDV